MGIISTVKKWIPISVKIKVKKFLHRNDPQKFYRMQLEQPFYLTGDTLNAHFRGGYSQFGQDIYCWTQLLGMKRNGFFVDVGGNHPIDSNNTFFLEKLGWKGIAFEPIPELNELWKTERRTECIQEAVGDSECEVKFTETDNNQLSGIYSQDYEARSPVREYKVRQCTIKAVFQGRNIKHVDYMSIDVEGYERNVIDGIDFNTCDIYCLDVENDKNCGAANLELREYICSKGYRFVGRLCLDDIFIKNV